MMHKFNAIRKYLKDKIFLTLKAITNARNAIPATPARFMQRF